MAQETGPLVLAAHRICDQGVDSTGIDALNAAGSRPMSQPGRDSIKNILQREVWWLIPAFVIYVLLVRHLEMTQDDAYITYRYIANYLNGHGLVFNIGERVEGFTNFGWTIYVLLAGVLRLDYIAVSKITGFVLGGANLWMAYLIGRNAFGHRQRWLAIAAVYVVAANQSLAYWAAAGLETAAFGFLVLLAVYLYLKRSYLLIFALAMAVWVRPEGAMVTGLLIAIEGLQYRKWPRYTVQCALAALVLSLPMVGFKYFYYGSILPNPFYAKTGFDLNQLANGLEYTGRFMSHYGFYGMALVIPLIFYRRLSDPQKALWLFAVGYTLYITLIGGDVLKAHRFYLPLFGVSAVLLVLSLQLVFERVIRKYWRPAVALVAIGLAVLTYYLPNSFVAHYDRAEKGLVAKMQFMAERLKQADHSDFSVAVGTIGRFGYELMGHDIIDMLGLTDSTIARHPDPPIPGMETTWKEEKHNVRYLLSREPTYIMFSTGIKPSAPAERALLLYRQFTDVYRSVSWLSAGTIFSGQTPILQAVYRKTYPMPDFSGPYYPVEYVDHYKRGLEATNANRPDEALAQFDSAMTVSPKPYFVYLVYQTALAQMLKGDMAKSEAMMDSLLVRDSAVFEAHMTLYSMALYRQNPDKAAIHRRWLQRLVPWLWPSIEARANRMLEEQRRYQQRQPKSVDR
jgi:hypothetical protein